jgi:peptide deformylase
MAVLKVATYPDPILSGTATPVTIWSDEMRTFADRMLETMYDAKGRGLAAPQVGVAKRLFVMDTTWKSADPSPMIFVNPEIVGASPASAVGEESCLSIPGRSFRVARPVWVEVIWISVNGIKNKARFHGIGAVCVCHEIDHLDGRLIVDHGTEV